MDNFKREGREICDIVDCLIDKSEEFLYNKYKLYCTYVLSLRKDEVNSEVSGFYEECRDFLNRLEESRRNKELYNLDMVGIRLKNL